MGAFPIRLAVPVVLDPPNGAILLAIEAACPSRSRRSIVGFLRHSLVIATSETSINTGVSRGAPDRECNVRAALGKS